MSLRDSGLRTGLPLLPKGLLSLLSPGGPRGLSILIYHRVLPRKDPLFPGDVDRIEFDRHMALVRSHFNVLPLRDAVRLMREGRLPRRAACITFDDGYADNADIALPILQKHGLHATFFIASGFLNGGRMWNDTVIETVRMAPGDVLDATELGLGRHALASVEDRRTALHSLIGQLKYRDMEERQQLVDALSAKAGRALPADLMMDTAQLRRLHGAGMHIGAHTMNHPILARIPAAQARQEIAGGRAALRELLDEEIPLFAYPNGKPGTDYGAEHVDMVRDLGFEAAVSTAWGTSRGRSDFFQLPRFTPWDRNRFGFVLRLARNLTQNAVTV
ncbi:polysaccharide deacetylase family protein [Pseudoduganella sp. UC29_106]|uniref:polysaccharide deacetylase family protein n=1 Tax=Pseudoduganella sp. UC29_106 TaxID=3374553 RepID=UPI00375802CB